MEAYRYDGTYMEAKNGMLKEGFDDWEHAFVGNGTASIRQPMAWCPVVSIRIPRAERCLISPLWLKLERNLHGQCYLRADGSSNFAKAIVSVTSLRYRQDGPLLTKNSWKVRKTGSTS